MLFYTSLFCYLHYSVTQFPDSEIRMDRKICIDIVYLKKLVVKIMTRTKTNEFFSFPFEHR